MSDHFSDWDGTDGSDAFALPGDELSPMGRGNEQAAPAASAAVAEEAAPQVEDLGEPTADELETLAILAAQGLQSHRAAEGLARQVVLQEAWQEYEEFDEEPAVIADRLRDQYGQEVAHDFVRKWKAEDAEFEEGPELPATAEEWADREQQRVAQINAVKQAYQTAEAEAESRAQQTALDAEMHQAFNEGVLATRDRHAALSRGRAGVTFAELAPIIDQLGVNVNPTTPEEARQWGEHLYRQAVELTRAMDGAELVASFESPREKALRWGYMPGPDEREESRNALPPDAERFNRFLANAASIDPDTTAPRPTFGDALHAEFDEHEANQRAFEDGFQVRGDGPTLRDLRPANQARSRASKPRAQTVADGWNV